MKFSMIVACDKNRGIGRKNDLPWHLPNDFRYFQTVTKETEDPLKKNAVIMGRKTWESIPIDKRPLKGRMNFVLSRFLPMHLPEGLIDLCPSLESVFEKIDRINKGHIKHLPKIENVFVIGGGNVYASAIKHPDCHKLYITEVDGTFNCDTFFPEFSKEVFKEISRSAKTEDSGVSYEFVVYQRSV